VFGAIINHSRWSIVDLGLSSNNGSNGVWNGDSDITILGRVNAMGSIGEKMKNPIDSAMFIKNFDFLTTEYSFIRKGSLFIRVVDNQMMQTVFPFKVDPVSIDINIGLYSVYENIVPVYIKEGRFRLSRLANMYFEIEDPSKTLLKMKELFIERVIPVFEKVTTMQELVIYNQHGHFMYLLDEFIAYLKLGDLDMAYKSLEAKERIERMYPSSIMEQKIIFEEIGTQKQAIESKEIDILSAIIDKNYLNNKKMLRPYGIYLN
jgi:hypothetical protein